MAPSLYFTHEETVVQREEASHLRTRSRLRLQLLLLVCGIGHLMFPRHKLRLIYLK